ncbi:MAG TPA: GTPase, partial [Planctomycetota bacterium]|nr:GTPase [Planctomycetota bacterium]
LFATLDTRTRLWTLRDGRRVLLSDTVGFVRRLPHHLVASFHATLAESIHADLLLVVVDASQRDAPERLAAVESTLADVGALAPRLLVLNQMDRVSDHMPLALLERDGRPSVRVSAATRVGLDDLDRRVSLHLNDGTVSGEVRASAADGRTIAELRASGIVESERYAGEDWVARMRFRRALYGRLQQLHARGAIRAAFTSDGAARPPRAGA